MKLFLCSTYIMILFLNLSCNEISNNPVLEQQGPRRMIMGFITYNSTMFGQNADVPLSRAIVTAGDLKQETDENGMFRFESIPEDIRYISILHAITGHVDAEIGTLDTVHLNYLITLVGGGVFRYLRPNESIRTSSLTFLRNRIPIAAHVIIDGIIVLDPFDINECNLSPLGGTLAYGSHRLQITSEGNNPLDTTLVVSDKLGCIKYSPNSISVTLTPIQYILFDWPLKIGTRWRYDYNLSQKLNGFGNFLIRHGIHTWTIVNATSVVDSTLAGGSKTIFTCQVERQDTLSGSAYPTPLVVIDTTSFPIIVCGSNIQVYWSQYHTIPLTIDGYSSHPGTVTSNIPGESFTCKEGIGLVYVNIDNVTQTQGADETHTLISLSVP
jgi:hypothetical protein